MTFGREKRLWLGWLALLAPIPLPFNQVLEWPFLFAYALIVIHFLQRAERGAWVTLENWALNLLGLFYLPIFYFDLHAAFLRGNAVTALLHLIMFLLVVKLYSIRREKDKWHIVVATYFLFVGAMATSSHISIAPYLVAFLVLGLLVLGRFAHLHVMAGLGDQRGGPRRGGARRGGARRLPFRTPLAFGTLLVLLVAVPLFATMPRIREPYILGRGTGSGGMARTTSFSDSVDLSLTSSIRGNRNVALRVKYEDETRLGKTADLRFKGAAYDRYRNRNWYRDMQQIEVLKARAPTPTRVFDLASEEPTINKASFFLEPLNSNSLVLPMEAVSLALDLETAVGIDPGGAVLIPARPREPIRYEVDLGADPVINAKLADDPESKLSALDTTGLTPRIRELARQVMGDAGANSDGERVASDDERVDRLEQHLLTQYHYTLDFLGRTGESPLEDFLFEYKSGHCEFFASAMVLMLRAEGIPARFVTGFLGAEPNPLEDYFMVQQNAHAWVEAYTESRGWRVYDPTPPDGRPSVAQQSLALLLTQVYDFITFRWDRYVLTYGAEDQEGFFRRMRERLRLFWDRFRELGKEEPTEPPAPFAADTATHEEVQSPWTWQPRVTLLLLMALFATSVAALVAWNRRRPLSGEADYLRLRSRLEHAGFPVTGALAPLELRQRAIERFPAATDAIRHIIGLYVRESFAGRELGERDRRGLKDALESVEKALKEQLRREKRERRVAKAA